MRLVKILCLLLCAGLLTGLPAAAESAPQDVRTLLEEAGYYVQSGSLYELDTLEEASQGRLLSCFGNNAGSTYMVLDLPPAPNQEPVKGVAQLNWPDEEPSEYYDETADNASANPYFMPVGWQYKLRQDEAIVLMGQMPPACKYYSFVNYILFTEEKAGKDYSTQIGTFSVGSEETGLYRPVFGSIGEPVNMQNILYQGDSAFDSQAVIVVSVNQTTTQEVVEQLLAAGYDQSQINVMPIPGVYNIGLQDGADTFAFLGRTSQPEDQAAMDAYMEELPQQMTVYRVTPQNEREADPYENQTVIPRGTGVHEAALVEDAYANLDALRQAIIDQYAGEYDYQELTSVIAVPEGLTAYFNDTNAQGDNRDASYLMTEDFTLDSDEDFVVVYGVNHTATGKGQYSNAILYARPMLNGVASAYDSQYEGSASAYLPEDAQDADKFYVYKFARTQLDDYTAVVEYSTGNESGKYYGVDNGESLFMAFRAYLDQSGVGPSYYEIIYDRAIVFHKK